ncbi:MAG: hypothetical protein JO336_14825, partial [Acidobacteriia bacterium]|nr:hypothetical protein [Terriglobia bacterium]
MTAPASQESPVTTQTAPPTAPARAAASADLKRLLAFGSGVGIEVGASDLTIVAVRVRFTRIHVGGFATIANFASRPAAEWGAEYAAFLRSNGMAHVSATVTLPRREVIVRQVMLAGV